MRHILLMGTAIFRPKKLRTDVHERSVTKLVGILLGEGAFLYFCDARCAAIWINVELDLNHKLYKITRSKRTIRMESCICCGNCGLTLVSAKSSCTIHEDLCEDRQWSRSVKTRMFCAGWEVDNGDAPIPWDKWQRVEYADVECGFELTIEQMVREI
jgi:hypothetical protein